jgi:hypothetical protein
MILKLAPDEAHTVLELPSWRVGRLVKASLRRVKKNMMRRCYRRRPRSTVLRT